MGNLNYVLVVEGVIRYRNTNFQGEGGCYSNPEMLVYFEVL